MSIRKRKAAAPAIDQSARDQIHTQRDELFNVMATIYVLEAMMADKQDDAGGEANYVSRVLRGAYDQCDRISHALEDIAILLR